MAGLQESVHRIRAFGSVAISLGQVALARVDGMATLWRTRAVDCAAGQLIVRESGGLVDFPGFPDLTAPLDLEPHAPLLAARTPEGLEDLADARRLAGRVEPHRLVAGRAPRRPHRLRAARRHRLAGDLDAFTDDAIARVTEYTRPDARARDPAARGDHPPPVAAGEPRLDADDHAAAGVQAPARAAADEGDRRRAHRRGDRRRRRLPRPARARPVRARPHRRRLARAPAVRRAEPPRGRAASSRSTRPSSSRGSRSTRSRTPCSSPACRGCASTWPASCARCSRASTR